MTLKVDNTGYVAGAQHSAPVEIEFKDGKHVIPEPVVAHLGGSEALDGRKDSFKDKTYQEFMKAFWKLLERNALNEMGSKFVQRHFVGVNPWDMR